MIISRTPFRISFFGGGTDFPDWYKENEGMVISTTIDKYCYVNVRNLPSFFNYKHRIVYSAQEMVNNSDEIKHPAVKHIFKFFNIDNMGKGLEVHHTGDLPARAGLGSSSSFTVGLINALYGLSGKMISKEQLYKDAIYVEQELIKESVGSQDQVAVTVGGLNLIKFFGDKIDVSPIFLTEKTKKEFQSRLMLFFTGTTRIASDIEKDKIIEIEKRKTDYSELRRTAEEGLSLILEEDFEEVGLLMDEAWKIKKSLSSKVSNNNIDRIYEIAKNSGAIGGKIIGAGGGGFMLLFVNPWLQKNVRSALSGLLEIPFKFENEGSKIIYYNGDIL